ncbi:glycosyltransferase family 2 protein [Mongoliitalea lutea]|uniref:Putative glycosyltransferase YkcC n=1 Tax=Mongoliitalea lutea TaxID=849756 RepID=A0A8J3CX44_9BACT|nr:glycosyltransferase family 2 protein [Mongoliitalea lutea]GHB37030.1 putative glycosyltransferase YkcC [Mongoliitalea lutea]
MNKIPFLSIVSPVYKAENIVSELVKRICEAIEPITSDYEIILVEDGSPDKSWEAIVYESSINSKIKGVSLSRNFGQHYAITAGLDHARGEWVVVMDCDLQDRPEEIHSLYEKTKEGFDVVLAQRIERQDSLVKKTSSKIFYQTLSYLTGEKQDPSVANFGIYHRRVIQAVQQLREPIRYFPTMVRWTGFKSAKLEVTHSERFSGSTSYNWNRLFRLALDIILANSDKPIRMIVKFGFFVTFISFFIGALVIYRYLMHQITVPGYTSLLVSIWFIGGMVLFVLGLIGLYIGKIFEGVKQRPIYIVGRTTNLND